MTATTLRPGTIDRIMEMWRRRDENVVSVSVVSINGETFINAPPRLEARLETVDPDLDAVLHALGDDVEHVVGAVRLAYADESVLTLDSTADVVRIRDDDAQLAPLAAAADAEEWREGSAGESSVARYAAFDDGRISAVATLGVWAELVGSFGVFTDARYRGRGLSGRVASAAIAEALQRGLVPQWQSLVTNTSSARVADKLGFVTLGFREIVRVRPPAG